MNSEPLAIQTTIAESVPYIAGAITDDQRKQLGYTLDEIVSRCTYAGKPCDMT